MFTAIWSWCCQILQEFIEGSIYVSYTGNYELIGITGVNKWIWAQEDAPGCDLDIDPGAGQEVQRRTKDAYMYVFATVYEHIFDCASACSVTMDTWFCCHFDSIGFLRMFPCHWGMALIKTLAKL